MTVDWHPTFLPLDDRPWFLVDAKGHLAKAKDGGLLRFSSSDDALAAAISLTQKDTSDRGDKEP